MAGENRFSRWDRLKRQNEAVNDNNRQLIAFKQHVEVKLTDPLEIIDSAGPIPHMKGIGPSHP